MKDTIVKIYKAGTFYNVYGEAGLILYYLLGYKFVEPKMAVGFPVSALAKVIHTLEDENISYAIYEHNKVVSEHKGISKNFLKVIKKAREQLDIEKRVNILRDKINSFSLDKLEKIIEQIENETS